MGDTIHSTLYDTDFYAWTQEQAARLREEEWEALDWQNLAEEIESMGRSEQNEVKSRLEVLIMHLLKWKYQPEHQSRSWRSTINIQRLDLERVLEDNPSLHARLSEFLPKAYERGAKKAFHEMQLLHWTFPPTCPYTVEQLLDEEFWP